MKIIETVPEMQRFSDALRAGGKRIGFVPTMGYFHEGHLSLMRIARERADVVVISIFVNPTQFGPDEDLEDYPRDFERDREMAESVGVDVIFNPSVDQMYPDRYQTYVTVQEVSKDLCGPSRPVHFRGVATVCTKLFCAVKPHFAVFGEKDYQQLQVINRLVLDLGMDLEIVPGPTFREPDGLAMSSRNVYLSPAERKSALSLRKALEEARRLFDSGEQSVEAIVEGASRTIREYEGTRIDYVKVADAASCIPLSGEIEGDCVLALAVYLGKTRLIDNMVFRLPESDE